jgi:hypothetical protein
MRLNPRLGLVNFALVSAYFVPVWGHEAWRVLTSPFNGFEDRAHAVAAVYYRDLFDFGLAGLIRTSELLARPPAGDPIPAADRSRRRDHDRSPYR